MNTENHLRQTAMQRNDSLERLLVEINSALTFAESRLDVDVQDSRAKLFLVGPLRSGTTLYMQWLASTCLVSYPTNLLSRFYGAAVLGSQDSADAHRRAFQVPE